MSSQTFTTTLLSKKQLTYELLELHFSKPPGFVFLAGQFAQFEIPYETGLVLRSYSIVSIPSDNELEFCVKLLPGGAASEHFFEMSTGSTINFAGPAGRFTCDSRRDCVFVATGTGLAPIMSQVRYELEYKKIARQRSLLFGVKTTDDIFWQDRLDALVNRFPNFSYRLTLSRPTDDWAGLTGHVTKHLPANLKGLDFYLCGSPAMVMEARGLLLAGGVAAADIHFEVF